MSDFSRDNHADQLNPNNDAYWQSRGHDERPDDWQVQLEEERDMAEEVSDQWIFRTKVRDLFNGI